MNYKYNQKLPVKVEKELDQYIERIKKIDWFKPKNLKRVDVDRQINVVLKAFGVEATIEYKSLKTEQDWDAAWDAAWGAAWGAARDAARDAARGTYDLLASLTTKKLGYVKKYPQGNFLQLVNLWEMGLYPCGVIDGKFVCYVPEGGENLFEEVDSMVAETPKPLDVIINGIKYVPEEQ